MLCGFSGFLKALTQVAIITASGHKSYLPNKHLSGSAEVESLLAKARKTNDPRKFKKQISKKQSAALLQWFTLQRSDAPRLIKAAVKRLSIYPERFCYAHNLQYDLGNLFGDELDTLDCTLVGGRLIKAAWGRKVFVDSFNIWPMSAKKLGDAFNLKKLSTASMATDRAYVYRDCEIIRKAMQFAWKFIQGIGIDYLPPTLGGLCVKVWKSWGGENCHDSNALSREAYYGGRVELFKPCNESKRIVWTDINSLYPFVMQKPFPAMLEDCGKKLKKHGVARIRVNVPKTALAVLPYRNDAGRVVYPWGRFVGVWTVPEINAAKANGTKVEKVFESWGTDDEIRPYGTFVQKLYRQRLSSKSEAEKLFFKLLMNNLYGRLGTSGTIGRTVWQTEKNRFDGVPYGTKVLVSYSMPLSEETNWAHAAYVTAYGRLELLSYMQRIGAENMIYCDTDSCIFDSPDGVPPFKTGSALGAMKVCQRCSVCQDAFPHFPPCKHSTGIDYWDGCETFAPKLYRVNQSFKAKGVPKHLAKKFIATGSAEFDLPFKMREAMRFFDRKNARKLSVWRRVSKSRREKYDRKHLIGNRFYPCKVLGVLPDSTRPDNRGNENNKRKKKQHGNEKNKVRGGSGFRVGGKRPQTQGNIRNGQAQRRIHNPRARAEF